MTAAAAGMRRKNLHAWLLAGVVGLAAYLRLCGIGYGLPAVFNSDEPHPVNIALSFGRGSLDPQFFKYPTLWMYVLFAAYVAYFLVWSGAGALHSVRQFGELFVWHPGGFFLIGRLLSAAFSLSALGPIWRAGLLLGGERAALAVAALLAVSPAVIMSAHAAKPDSLMLFWAACAWLFALRYHVQGRRRDLFACAAAAGLAASTQYVAAPLAALVAFAWGTRPVRSRRARDLAWSAAAWTAAFLASSPFILIDWRSFLRDLQDLRIMAGTRDAVGAAVARNILSFIGPWWTGAPLLAAGVVRLCRSRRPLAILLLGPVIVQACVLASSGDGAWPRFLIGVFPALAAVAALGMELVPSGRVFLLAALMLPGAWESFAFDRNLLLPDTRTLAERWFDQNISPGVKVLADQEHSCPRLTMSPRQVERMLEQSRRTGHPREKYYELMLSGHPGGGYEVYRILRDFTALQSGPWHVGWSNRGRDMLDVRGGLQVARAAGVEVVVLSSFGADARHEPALAQFMREISSQGTLLIEFRPEEGRIGGPDIRIYSIQ